jgi:hypothetical protein
MEGGGEMNDIHERFLKNVATHKLTVLLDNEAYRHIRLQSPETRNCYFDIVTWPGSLVISGDMGTYAFERLYDMFEFFRPTEHDKGINPHYWSEKCIALDNSCRRGALEAYSQERFRDVVMERFNEWVADEEPDTEDRTEILSELLSIVANGDSEEEARRAIEEFNDKHELFSDFWEVSLREWTYSYLWNLYAIVWGIEQYYKFKMEAPR